MAITLVENVLKEVAKDAKSMVLCVDGTSCCKKTSILAATGMENIMKVQKNRKFVNVNTFAPSMLGYISTGLLDVLSTAEHAFMDRSPMNVLEWHFLWKFMHKFYTEFGNVLPDPDNKAEHGIFFVEFDRIFDDLKLYCKSYRALLDVVCIIDSNVDRCDRDRLYRNTGTDFVRSSWKFYTFMQNRMYKRLYRCIDLAWFDNDDMECGNIIVLIASCLKHALLSFPKIPQRHYGRVNYCLPIPIHPNNDLTLRNYNTFVYREVIRQKARYAVQSTEDDVDVSQFTMNFDELPQFADILGLSEGELRLTPFVIKCRPIEEMANDTLTDNVDTELYMNESNMETLFS